MLPLTGSCDDAANSMSDEVSALLYGESFTAGIAGAASGTPAVGGGVAGDLVNPSDGLGFTSQFRAGTFNGNSFTSGQLVRNAALSGLVGDHLAFKMTSAEGYLVPFVSHGSASNAPSLDPLDVGASFVGQDIGSWLDSPKATGARPLFASLPGLSFSHGLSTTPGMAVDASKGLRSRQFELSGSRMSAGFSRLSIGAVDSPDLIKDVTDSINTSFASRSALGPANNSLLKLTDVKALKGVNQRDGFFNFNLSSALSVGTEVNDIETQEGNIHLQDYKMAYGKFYLTGTKRNLDHALTDTALKGMGRDDLIALKGTEAQEWTAFLPFLMDSKGGTKFALTHYRKDEIVDKSGDLTTATENHARRNTVQLNPLSSTSLQFTEEQTESGNVERADGTDLDTTTSQTYLLTQKFADHTTTTLTRNSSFTDKGAEGEDDIRSESVALHVDTKPWKQLAVVGDWNRIDNSKDGETADAKLKVTAPLNKSLSVSADLQDKYTTLSGPEEHQSYTLSYLWNKTSKLSLTTKMDRTGPETAVKTTYSNTFSVTPWKDTTVDYTMSDIIDPTTPSFSQKITLRQRLLESVSIVARHQDTWSETAGDEGVNTCFFDWTKEKFPYSLQVGFETLDLNQVADSETTDSGQSVVTDKPAVFAKLTANPSKSLSFSGSYARRRDLTEEPLELRDWTVTKSFGKRWSLTAKEFENKPTADSLDDSVLPFSKGYEKKTEWDYSLGFPMNRLPLLSDDFTGSLGYSRKEDATANTVAGELFLAVTKKLDPKSKLTFKIAQGTGTATGEVNDYFTYSFSYGVHIGDINELSLSGRYTDDGTFAPTEEGNMKIDLTFRRLF